jgi:hypothetical protein
VDRHTNFGGRLDEDDVVDPKLDDPEQRFVLKRVKAVLRRHQCKRAR